MTLSPVSLAEARVYLNLSESDGHGDDEELWQSVLAATDRVEARVGAIRPRQVVSRVTSDGMCIILPQQPVISVERVQDYNDVDVALPSLWLDTDRGALTSVPLGGYLPRYPYVYTVTYTVGRDPIPQAIMDAVLCVTSWLWETQRGPDSTSRFSQTGGGDGVYRGPTFPKMAAELLVPYRQFSVA